MVYQRYVLGFHLNKSAKTALNGLESHISITIKIEHLLTKADT